MPSTSSTPPPPQVHSQARYASTGATPLPISHNSPWVGPWSCAPSAPTYTRLTHLPSPTRRPIASCHGFLCARVFLPQRIASTNREAGRRLKLSGLRRHPESTEPGRPARRSPFIPSLEGEVPGRQPDDISRIFEATRKRFKGIPLSFRIVSPSAPADILPAVRKSPPSLSPYVNAVYRPGSPSRTPDSLSALSPGKRSKATSCALNSYHPSRKRAKGRIHCIVFKPGSAQELPQPWRANGHRSTMRTPSPRRPTRTSTRNGRGTSEYGSNPSCETSA